MAAGLSLPQEHVEAFRRTLNENAALTDEDLRGKIVIDVPMPLAYITKELIEELNILEPFGKSNEKPVFADKDIEILSMRILGKNRNVCKMQVRSADSQVISAVYFGETDVFLDFLEKKYGKRALTLAMEGEASGMKVSFVYYPEIDSYNGRENIQIVVKNYC